MPPPGNKFYSARILERRDISDDLWALRLDPGGEFPFRSGQYATLGVVTPEKHHERPYSIVSAHTNHSWSFSSNWFPTAK